MRISCLEGDAGYAEWTRLLSQGKDAEIFLNGVPMDNVVIADDQKDEVVCHATPFRTNPATGDVVLETYYGRVSIEIVDVVLDVAEGCDTFQVEFQDDPGDCDMLPSDVFCMRNYDGRILSWFVLDEFGNPPIPEFEVEINFDLDDEFVDLEGGCESDLDAPIHVDIHFCERDGKPTISHPGGWFTFEEDHWVAHLNDVGAPEDNVAHYVANRSQIWDMMDSFESSDPGVK